jgi:hypothetical protein
MGASPQNHGMKAHKIMGASPQNHGMKAHKIMV